MDPLTPQDRAALDRIVGEALLKDDLAETLCKQATRRALLKLSLSRKAAEYLDQRIGNVASLTEFSQSIYNLSQPASD